jgi:hypothetical protein
MRNTRVADFFAGRRFDWTVAITMLIVAMLPVGALRPWTNDLARVVLVPLVPVTHLGMFVKDRIRPPQQVFDARAPETIALEAELAQTRAAYERARLEVVALEDSLRSLRAVSTRAGSGSSRLIEAVVGGTPETATAASIVAVDRARAQGVFFVNAGARHGVVAGTPVFADGDVLVGLVADNVAAFVSPVVPATRLPSMSCRILPAEGSDPTRPMTAYPGAVLKPAPNGRWSAEVASASELSVGMIARIADERFPRSALGARVGQVVSVQPIEQVPLARRIEVEPIVDPTEVRAVVLVTELDSSSLEGKRAP